MSIKLVAIDIDGTLLNSQHQITTEVHTAIQDAKKAGVKIVIATGRPISGVRAILEELNLTDTGDYVITFNGGLVQDAATGEDIVKDTLSYDDYLDIELVARKFNLPMHASTKEGIYTANRNIGKYTIYESTLVSAPIFYRTPEEMVGKEIIKTMMVDEPLRMKKSSSFRKLFSTSTISPSQPPSIWKSPPKQPARGKLFQYLAEYLGLTLDQTMAIGDQENDRSMLEMVHNPVVMENGTAELKKIAKYITKSNQESGVAHAIREWVLD
jgi:Cof subfamily protein (haloacid dehalogenase superfamily)